MQPTDYPFRGSVVETGSYFLKKGSFARAFVQG